MGKRGRFFIEGKSNIQQQNNKNKTNWDNILKCSH